MSSRSAHLRAVCVFDINDKSFKRFQKQPKNFSEALEFYTVGLTLNVCKRN